MFPSGDLLIYMKSSTTALYRWEDGKYVFGGISFSGSSQAKKIICSSDDNYYSIHSSSIILRTRSAYPLTGYALQDEYEMMAVWRSPNFFIIASDPFLGNAYLVVLDDKLQEIHREPYPEFYYPIHHFGYRDSLSYYFGLGYTWFDKAFFGTYDHTTHEGPLHYDLELVDFNAGPYDSSYFTIDFGSHYVYHIPEASVTVRNKGPVSVNSFDVYYSDPTSFCSDTGWVRTVETAIGLLPGQVATYPIQDIFIRKLYPHYLQDRHCFAVLGADNYRDDDVYDNHLCKEIEFVPVPGTGKSFPVQHYPAVIGNHYNFYAQDEKEFEITIYTLDGRRIHNSNHNTTFGQYLDTSFLPPGIYIFQYKVEGRNEIYTERLLKL
jgi:hypothetical protein